MPDRIVVSLPEGDNEYQRLQAADAEAAAARLGLEAEVLYADNNAVLQIQQLFKVIHAPEAPRAIVVEPVAVEGMERLARRAAGAGIGTAILNHTASFLERLRGEFPALPLLAVGSDQAEIGRLQGRQVAALLPSGGSILYVQGPPNTPVVAERLKGTEEVLARSGVEMLVVDAHWSEESASRAVQAWLRLKTSENARIDAVAGQDDSIARGARRAFEASGLLTRDVPFLGIDGVPSVGQKLVSEGQLAATIIMPSNTGPALDVLARWLRSGTLPPLRIRVPVASFPAEADLRARGAARGRPPA
jgi:ribose transport system substrate-binding protein